MALTNPELSQSVLPLFVPHDQNPERPDRAGSCVLVRLFDRHFVVTVKHVFGRFDKQLFFLGRPGFPLIPLTVGGLYTTDDLDVAVIPLSDTQLATLGDLVFIPEHFVDGDPEQRPRPSDAYVVFGFPDSNSQFTLDHKLRKIKQLPFRLSDGGKTRHRGARRAESGLSLDC